MSNDLETPPDAGVGVMELVSGIIMDVHVLIRQQLALFRYELKGETSRALDAGSLVAVGFAIVLMGSLLLCGMLVYLLAWIAPGLPLWGCCGIVGTPIVVLGSIVCAVGIQRLRRLLNTRTVVPAQDIEEKVDG